MCRRHIARNIDELSTARPSRATPMTRSILLWLAVFSQSAPAVVGRLARQVDVPGKLGRDVGNRRGDPNRDFKFWVYPRERQLVNRQWDIHKHPRDYCTKYRVNKRLENVCRASCARGLDH